MKFKNIVNFIYRTEFQKLIYCKSVRTDDIGLDFLKSMNKHIYKEIYLNFI